MKRYRVEISGSTVELEAKSNLAASMKVIKMSVEQKHIERLLNRYGRFTVCTKEVS